MAANAKPDSQFHAVLELPTATHIVVGAGSAMLVTGWCFHTQVVLTDLAVMVNDVRYPVSHWGLVRLDVRDAYRDAARWHSGVLRSGFRVIIPLDPISTAQTIALSLEATLDTGGSVRSSILKTILLTPHLPPPEPLDNRPGSDLIAICLRTYETDPAFLDAQIGSILRQTDPNWLCLIQDDSADTKTLAYIQALVGQDARFIVGRNEPRLGFSANFEYVLSMVPEQAAYVMLCDHDNIWEDDVLEVYRAAMAPDVMLVTSDMTIIDNDGQVLWGRAWINRQFAAESLDHLLLANTISGSASFFRREVLDIALPFVHALPKMYEDQWVGLAALALGRIVFIDRPLIHYRQHHHNILGWQDKPPVDHWAYRPQMRDWFQQTHYDRRAWQQYGANLSAFAVQLAYRQLWAAVLLRRLPAIIPPKKAQLEGILQADRPYRLRQWIRARSGPPRVTLHMDWIYLYAQVMEQAFSRIAQHEWQSFNGVTRAAHAPGSRARRIGAPSLYAQKSDDSSPADSPWALLQQRVEELEAELDYIRSRRGWKILQWWYNLKASLLSIGSRQQRNNPEPIEQMPQVNLIDREEPRPLSVANPAAVTQDNEPIQDASRVYAALRFRSDPPDDQEVEKVLLPPSDIMRHVQGDDNLYHWVGVGREVLHYSRVLADIQPSYSILEIGCGAGRIAMAMASFLQSGRYEGFDIHAESIAWAQQFYQARWPHVRFQHADLHNRAYNPGGTIQAAAFQFPYPDHIFDTILLTSVFTHMLPPDVAHYWNEIARTLKPGGCVLATAFLLNDASRPHMSNPQNTVSLPYNLGEYRIHDLYEPEQAVAYEETFMRTLITASGLVLERVYYGSWCGREDFLSYQDMMVVRRAR